MKHRKKLLFTAMIQGVKKITIFMKLTPMAAL